MPETPSIVELLERLVALEKAVVERDARIEALEAENAELRRRLGQTPRNSNMPPSAQGLDKPAPRSLRGRSGRRAGGQGGHEGRTLRQVDVPDEIVRHEPAACAGCGDGLADAAVVAVTRRQVFEIPAGQGPGGRASSGGAPLRMRDGDLWQCPGTAWTRRCSTGLG